MSRNVIPTKLRPEFLAHMEANDNDNLSDGAWFAVLEDAAESFMKSHGLTRPWHDRNDAVHQYLRMKEQP